MNNERMKVYSPDWSEKEKKDRVKLFIELVALLAIELLIVLAI